MDITDKIRAVRAARGVSQAEVARLLQLDPSSYYRLENRGPKLSLEQAERIAGALGLSLIELLTWGERSTDSEDNLFETKESLRIEELEDRLNDKNKLIEDLENKLFVAKSALTEFIWSQVNRHAFRAAIGGVKLIFKDPFRIVDRKMSEYRELLHINHHMVRSKHIYEVHLNSAETDNILYAVLFDNEELMNLVSTFFKANLNLDHVLAKSFKKVYESHIHSNVRVTENISSE